MKIAILDVTARNAVQYNPSLCKALADNNSSNQIYLLSPKLAEVEVGYKFIKLLNIVPNKWELSTGRFKRIVRAFEVLANYIYVTFLLLFKRPNILHIQWLPFLEFSHIEHLFLSLFKLVDPKLKIVLTVHNIYPHESGNEGRISYRRRFIAISKKIDVFLVHLNSAKKELAQEFGISDNRIFVAYHGIYTGKPAIKTKETDNSKKKKVILYGYQSKYKGADILIKAYSLLPKRDQESLSITIVGKTDNNLYRSYAEEAETLGINWINKFVPDDELYAFIDESDLILLPYREISQSGVLLLALSYKKPILTSDIPSFKETMAGYPAGYFFESGNAESLASLLSRFVSGGIDEKLMVRIIEDLNEKYSWKETAKSTMKAYLYAQQ